MKMGASRLEVQVTAYKTINSLIFGLTAYIRSLTTNVLVKNSKIKFRGKITNKVEGYVNDDFNL